MELLSPLRLRLFDPFRPITIDAVGGSPTRAPDPDTFATTADARGDALPPGVAAPAATDDGRPARLPRGARLAEDPRTLDAQRDVARANARRAVGMMPSAPSDHPWVAANADARKAIAAAGLPNDGAGVEIHVLMERDPIHGPDVTRAAAGPGSLTPNADAHLHPALLPKEGAPIATTLDGVIAQRVEHAAEFVDRAADEVAKLRQNLPPSERVRVANLSVGTSAARLAEQAARQIRDEGGDALLADINARRAAEGLEPISRDAQEELAAYLAPKLEAGLAASPELDRARLRLGEEVRAARAANIYTVAAASNDGASPFTDAQERSVLADIDGLPLVGASRLAGGGEHNGALTSPGAEYSTIGIDVPVRLGDSLGGPPADGDGTSYAAPRAASIVALMVGANPDIRPDQIDAILAQTAHDDPRTERDGVGYLDAAAAVIRAAELRN
ncbi:MAG: S8/S53 family peptidase [Deltaproteobacteria bacterium]